MLALKCNDNEFYTFHRVHYRDGSSRTVRIPASAHSCSSFLSAQGESNFKLIVNASSEEVQEWFNSHDEVKLIGLFKI